MDPTVQQTYDILHVPPLDDVDFLVDVWVPLQLGFSIPDWPMCREHSTPRNYLRNVLAMDTPGTMRYPRSLLVTNRGGGKSMLAALIVWLKARYYRGYEGRILAGSGDQAKKCYKHTLTYWNARQAKFIHDVLGNPKREETILLSGSGYGIQKASETSVRGGHPNDLIIDEADVVPADILSAALSQPMRKQGSPIPAQLLYFSTINRAGGVVENLIANSKQTKLPIWVYCWKECAATCDLPIKCEHCELATWCRGDMRMEWRCQVLSILQYGGDHTQDMVLLRRHDGHATRVRRSAILETGDIEVGQTVTVLGNPHGYMWISDIIEKLRSGMSTETWESEWCCQIRQAQGAVLRRLLIDQALTDMEYQQVEPKAYDPHMPYTWIGVDWGYRNETSSVVFQWDGHYDLRIVSEAWWTERSGSELAKLITEMHGDRYQTRIAYSDASHPGNAKDLRIAGWTVHSVPFKAYKDPCLEALRVWLEGKAGRRMTINARCDHLATALRSWHYKERVTDEHAERAIAKIDDHPCDAVLAGMRRFAIKRDVDANDKVYKYELKDLMANLRSMGNAASRS